MIDVVVDTALLACPVSGAPYELYERYVEGILDLRDATHQPVFRLMKSCWAEDILVELDRMPPWTSSPIDHYIQREQLSSVFYGVLARLLCVQDHCSVRFVSLASASCVPADFLDGHCDRLKDDVHQSIGTLAYWRQSQEPSCDPFLMTASDTTRYATFNEEIELLENENSVTIVPSPRDYKVTVIAGDRIQQLSDALGDVKLWLLGAYVLAIECAIRAASQQTSISRRRVYRVGRRFLESARDYGFLTDRAKVAMLIRTIANTVLGLELGKTHALRTGREASKPQIEHTGGGSFAWRRDIDYEFHLHYWQGDDIELACVRPHNEFDIPE